MELNWILCLADLAEFHPIQNLILILHTFIYIYIAKCAWWNQCHPNCVFWRLLLLMEMDSSLVQVVEICYIAMICFQNNNKSASSILDPQSCLCGYISATTNKQARKQASKQAKIIMEKLSFWLSSLKMANNHHLEFVVAHSFWQQLNLKLN